MNVPYPGDLAPYFTDYTTAANVALVNRAYDETPFLRDASEESRLRWALHAEKETCIERKRTRAVRH